MKNQKKSKKLYNYKKSFNITKKSMGNIHQGKGRKEKRRAAGTAAHTTRKRGIPMASATVASTWETTSSPNISSLTQPVKNKSSTHTPKPSLITPTLASNVVSKSLPLFPTTQEQKGKSISSSIIQMVGSAERPQSRFSYIEQDDMIGLDETIFQEDNYGIDCNNIIANSEDNENIINGNNLSCECLNSEDLDEKLSSESFFELSQLYNLNVPTANFNFLPFPTKEMYVFSHFITPNVFISPQGTWNKEMINGNWINKYIKWMLYNCIATLYLTNYNNGLRSANIYKLGYNIPNERGDSNVGIKYIMDKYSWETLKILHQWPGMPQPSDENSPFVSMVLRDLNENFPEWPKETETQLLILEVIREIWTTFYAHRGNFTNYSNQYAYLWWLAGIPKMNIHGQGSDANNYYTKTYGIFNHTGQGRLLETSRVQFMFYEFPMWRQILGGVNGIPPFPIHGLPMALTWTGGKPSPDKIWFQNEFIPAGKSPDPDIPYYYPSWEQPYWMQSSEELDIAELPPIPGIPNAIPQDCQATHIGQLVRYLILIQQPYKLDNPEYRDMEKWDGSNENMSANTYRIICMDLTWSPHGPGNQDIYDQYINRAIHTTKNLIIVPNSDIIHFRDGHASCSSINSVSLENYWLHSGIKYLSGHSIHYTSAWHESRKGWFAGYFSARKKKNIVEETIMPIHQWKSTFGRAFCMIKRPDGNLGIVVCPHRRVGTGINWFLEKDKFVQNISRKEPGTQSDWGYGIDEYVGSFMYLDRNGNAGWQPEAQQYCKDIFADTLYTQIMWLGNVYQSTSQLLFRVNLRDLYQKYPNIDEANHILRTEFIEPLFNKGPGNPLHDKLVGNLDLRGTIGNGNRINSKFDFPDFLQPHIIIFYLNMCSLERLLLDFFYYNGISIQWWNTLSPSWKDVKDYMYTVHELELKYHDMDIDETPKNNVNKLERARGNWSVDDFSWIFLLIPPQYGFFNTLFNNSENAQNYSSTTGYKPSQSQQATENLINELIKAIQIPNSEYSNFIYYYKKIYDFYGCADLSNPHRETCGWDLRQWYNPLKNVTVSKNELNRKMLFKFDEVFPDDFNDNI